MKKYIVFIIDEEIKKQEAKEEKKLILADYSYALDSKLNPAQIMRYEGDKCECEIIQEDICIHSKSEACQRYEKLDICVRAVNTGNIYFTQSRFLREMTNSEIKRRNFQLNY